jgi:hypothetical protein
LDLCGRCFDTSKWFSLLLASVTDEHDFDVVRWLFDVVSNFDRS